MAYHSRTDWRARQARRRIRVDPDRLEGICIHYAGFDIDPARNTGAVLRSIQAAHIDRLRWYDIAYSLAVDHAGDVYELRGLEIENGAQGGRRLNRRYVAILALLGPGQHPDAAMIDGLREAVSMVRERWPQCKTIIPHSEVKPTSCPGDPLRAAIADRSLESQSNPAARRGHSGFQFGEGAEGDLVARVQRVVGVTADGKFGPATASRVRDIQRACTVQLGDPTGIVDMAFWSWLVWAEGVDS